MGLFDPPAPDAVKEKERERELLETQKESKACYFCKIIFFVGALLTFSFIYEKEKIQKERSAEVEKGLTPSGVLPNFSGEYMIRMFYTDPDYFSNWEYNDVTVATQCSANHLHHVVKLWERWSGPISVAVFAPNLEASFATDAILSMQKCWPDMKKRVTFHLVYPTQHKADVSESSGTLNYNSCEELRQIIHDYGGDDSQNYKGDIPYPHNVLRNAARKGAATEFVFLIDVDVMPSLHMREGFNEFANKFNLYEEKEDKAVFVVPVFEILKGHQCPDDKADLKDAQMTRKEVRPFHNATCRWCHEPEDHDNWLMKPKNEHMEVAFNATWNKSWEPFYIARRNVPLFDERFKQYGFDRIEQICELHVAGYRFSVLNNAFLVHDGWKEAHAAARMTETFRNWVLFHFHFQQALLKMYDEPLSCAPVQTWIPRGQRLLGDINNRHARIQRKFLSSEV